ncbi:MAG: hypothetical protein H7301_10400 [Cryobacterium sp.]|nr:hypothetical protein [Oligoflexia bacterium]
MRSISFLKFNRLLFIILSSIPLIQACSPQVVRISARALSSLSPSPPLTVLALGLQSTPLSSSLSPLIVGTAGTGVSKIDFYSNSTCTSFIGSGTASTFSSTGITISVPTANASFPLYGVASDATGLLVSNCQLLATQFTHDSIPPAITIGGPSITGINVTGDVNFPVNFVGASQISLADSDLNIITTGGVVCIGKLVTGTGLSTRTVNLSGCSGNGSVAFSIASGTARDAAGNIAGSVSSSGTVLVNNTAPTIAISSPSQSVVNAGAGVSYTLTYGGATSVSLTTADVCLNSTGTASCQVGIGGSGLTTRTVILYSCVGDGTITVSIASGTAANLSANAAPAAGPSLAITLDNTAPTIAISAPSSSNIQATSGTVTYTVTYLGASNITLSSGNIGLNTTGGSTCSVAVTGSGSVTRTVSFSGCTVPGGTVGFTIASGTATDSAGNTATASSASGLMNVIAGTPALLAITTQPSTAVSTQAISPGIVVQIRDSNSNLANTSSSSVTLNISTNVGGSTLSGTLTRSAVGGVATFSDISLNKIGTSYRLTAASSGLTSAVSTTFNILLGAPSKLTFVYPTLNTIGKSVCSSVLTLQSQDAGGNIAAIGSAINVNLSQNGAGISQYYSTAGCNGSAITQVTIPTSGTQVQFYMRHDTAEAITLTASAGSGSGFTDATRSLAVGTDHTTFAVGNSSHYCRLLPDTTVSCWGNDSYGQLGDGLTTTLTTPFVFPGLTNVLSVGTGENYSCFLMSTGIVRCIGSGIYGNLGNGSNSASNTLVTVSGITNAVSLSVGNRHSCALLSDSTVKCWGQNFSGNLGNNSTTSSNIPVTAGSLTGVVSIRAGSFHTCALLGDGSTQCWGANNYGQMGNGSQGSNVLTPVSSTVGQAVAITVTGNNTCALISDGSVKCWGIGTAGNNGNSSFGNSYSPVSVTGISNAITVAGAGCALLATGSVKCWGDGFYGQVGQGYTVSPGLPSPATVINLSGVVQIASNGYTNCAVLSDASIKCWGYGGGAGLGFDSTLSADAPFLPVGLPTGVYAKDVTSMNNGGSGTTSCMVSPPSGILVNRFLLAAITIKSASITITPPSGWTLADTQSVGTLKQSIYYRVATSADTVGSSYYWTFSSAVQCTATLANFVNVDPAAPILAIGGQATASSVTVTAPSLTTSETNFASVFFSGSANNYTPTKPSGYASFPSSPWTTGTFGFYKPLTTAGATGTLIGTLGAAADNVGHQILLKKVP